MYEYCKSCVHDKGDIGFCDKCGYTYMHRKHGLPPTEYEAEPKPQTNADRIRAMTDEELAELFKSPLFFNKPWCCLHENPCRHLDSKEFKCAECLLDWLKQEAE